MPELPEVEIAAGQFRSFAEGHVLSKCRVLRPSIVKQQSPRTYQRHLKSKKVGRVFRRGKNVFADLEEIRLWIHLGMTGKLAIRQRGETPRFGRVSWEVEGRDSVLWLCDQRVFGGVAAAPAAVVDVMSKVDELGPDAHGIDGKVLGTHLVGSKQAIKVALMDQKRLAGLGNIHAAEALFFAKIQPSRPANELSVKEFRALAKGIQKTIDVALKHTMPEGNKDVVYISEGGKNPFSVYNREGKTCKRRACPGSVRRAKHAGRSTYYCALCQI